MENIELIFSLIGTCIGLIITLATIIGKYVSSKKAKRLAEQTIEICNAILPYIEQAESYIAYSGQEKKEYVMTKANRYAIEKGIAFDESAISEKVEELLELTKTVNAHEKRVKTESSDKVAQKDKKIIKIPSKVERK